MSRCGAFSRKRYTGGPIAIRAIVISGLTLIMTGCTGVWFDPYINVDERKFEDTRTGSRLPQLLSSAQKAEEYRIEVQDYRQEIVVGRSILTYGTFGAAAGSGVAALYGAHPDTVLGLALGAAGGYGAASLFASTDRVKLYSATGRTLDCIASAADFALATERSLTNLTTKPEVVQGTNLLKGTDTANPQEVSKQPPTGANYESRLEDLRSLIDEPIEWEEEDLKAALQALQDYELAKSNLLVFIALDASFSTVLDKATRLTLQGMEAKIADTQPELDAVLRTAESIGSIAVSYAGRVTPPTDEDVKEQKDRVSAALERGKRPRKPSLQQKLKLASLTSSVIGAAERLNSMITSATNRVNEVGSECVLALPATPPLTVSPSEVSISDNQAVTLVSRGGKLPLSYSWQGIQPPSDQIQVILSNGRDIILIGKSEVPKDQSYKLLIRDSLAASEEAVITVNTPSAKLFAQPSAVVLTPSDQAEQTKTVTLTGGKEVYAAEWVGPAPAKITKSVSGSTITLTAEEGAVASQTHTLFVRDSSSPSKETTISVEVK